MIKPLLRNISGMGTVGVILVVLVVLIAAAGIGVLLGIYTSGGTFSGMKGVLQPPFDGKRTVRILMLGEDNTGLEENRRGLSDTIMLISIDLDAKHVAALSIPRDTMIELEGYGGTCKINAAHVYGGPTLTELAVAQLVGIQPDYYIKTNVEGFKELVDILGGVQIDVDKNMRYTDRRGGLFINLKKGPQLLNGEKAMQYVRFRHDAMGDITRIQRQQNFLKALMGKALAAENLPKLPQTIRAVLKNVDTDLNLKDAIYLARFFSKLDMNQMKTETLPGVPQTIGGISYWVADYEQIAQVTQTLFFPPIPGLPTVEVLNGSGVNGAANKVADAFRQHGYDVISTGNADSYDYASSQVIGHKPDLEGMDQIASLVNTSTIKEELNPSTKADVTVIVGKDCMLIN